MEQLPWVEKYRPQKVSDVSHQKSVVETLNNSVRDGNLPHLLFYGTPGTGKTTVALALSRQLFGKYYKERTLELNASDDRGISAVRTKIKQFALTTVPKRVVNGEPLPDFKMIILDEADSMTKDAQSALRRTMELFTRVTRFCLMCNYVSKVIEPIASRCAKFRFQPLSQSTMVDRLRFISREEALNVQDEALKEIYTLTDGDMRRAINLLQLCSQQNNNSVSRLNVQESAGKIPEKFTALMRDILESHRYSDLIGLCKEMFLQGFAVDLLLDEIGSYIYQANCLNDQQKSLISLKLAAVDMNLSNGADAELQLMSALSYTGKVFREENVCLSNILS